MPRNGTGTYTPPAGNPVVTGTTITTPWGNNTVNDISAELTNSLPRDGQAPPTANLPMGSFRHTGAGNPVGAQDYVTLAYLTGGTLTSIGLVPLAAATAMKLNGFTAGLLLGRQNIAVSAPADVTEDTLFTVTIPANSMGANGTIKIPPFLCAFISTANDLVTFRVRFDGTLVATFSQVANTGGAVLYVSSTFELTIANRNATNSQICSFGTGFGGGLGTLTAIDTTIAKNITFTAQKAVAGDTATLNQAMAFIYPST